MSYKEGVRLNLSDEVMKNGLKKQRKGGQTRRRVRGLERSSHLSDSHSVEGGRSSTELVQDDERLRGRRSNDVRSLADLDLEGR